MVGATDNFLKHYGVIGMKWGRRKSYKNSVKISGGRRTTIPAQLQPISKDAKNAQSFAKVAKTHGTQALSNQQLQALVNRQNLERQYSQLNPAQLSKGQKIMKQLSPMIGDVVVPGLAQTGYAAYKSMRPQQAPKPKEMPSSSLELYTPPSSKRIAGEVLGAIGKQVLSQYGPEIGQAIVKSLLKG